MTHVRMYAPMLVLLLWALLLAVFSLGRMGAVLALVTVAWAVKVQVDEARRQHRSRVRRS